jgi:hypothetical protein
VALTWQLHAALLNHVFTGRESVENTNEPYQIFFLDVITKLLSTRKMIDFLCAQCIAVPSTRFRCSPAAAMGGDSKLVRVCACAWRA